MQAALLDAHRLCLLPDAKLLEEWPEDSVHEVDHLQRLPRLPSKDQAMLVRRCPGDGFLDRISEVAADCFPAYRVRRLRRLHLAVPDRLPHAEGQVDRVEVFDAKAGNFSGADPGLSDDAKQRLPWLL